ncbi:MAG: hypothetical protein HQL08_15115 [Nitrospirae bacterium]|nr:hypothetical protein [Nitrospirota bacterium]
MHRLLSLVFILIATPGILSAQETIRTSRYERAGAAVKSSSEIDVLRERYGVPARFLIISPSLGDDIVLAVYKTDFSKALGGLIHAVSYPDFFNKDAVTAYYMLLSNEPVIIGGHAYSFDVDGEAYEIHYIKNGLVATGLISSSEAFLSRDGYLLKVGRSKKHE